MLAFCLVCGRTPLRFKGMSRLGVTDAARTRAQNEIAPSTPAVEDA
jgi:hypothetical protein